MWLGRPCSTSVEERTVWQGEEKHCPDICSTLGLHVLHCKDHSLSPPCSRMACCLICGILWLRSWTTPLNFWGTPLPCSPLGNSCLSTMAVACEESSFKWMFLLAHFSVSCVFFFYAWNLLCFQTPRMTDWQGRWTCLSQILYCIEEKKSLVPGTWNSSRSWWVSGS